MIEASESQNKECREWCVKYAAKFLSSLNMDGLFSADSPYHYKGTVLLFKPLRIKFQLALDLIIRFIIEYERKESVKTNADPFWIMTIAFYAAAHGLDASKMKNNHFPILMMMFQKFIAVSGRGAQENKTWVSDNFYRHKKGKDEFLSERLNDLNQRATDYFMAFFTGTMFPPERVQSELDAMEGIGTQKSKPTLN